MTTELKSEIKIKKQRGFWAKQALYVRKIFAMLGAVLAGFYLILRYRLDKKPNDPNNTKYVQYFCRRLCAVFNVQVQVHGEIPRQPALWVSNHISWLDVAVLGSGARVFFLAKAEISKWPVIGRLARGGGTLFIRRGSGDSVAIRDQMADFLKQDIPVLFFPEATTTDGRGIKKIHGRLLGAAIEAQRPVQVSVICYIDQQGRLDLVSPFVGNIGFLDHVKQVLEMDQVIAHLYTLPAIETTGHSVESLTALVHQTMQQALAELQQKLLGEVLQSTVNDESLHPIPEKTIADKAINQI